MTRLLVSVRHAAEALEALAGGADLIDIKEPAHGALGAAHPQVWREIDVAVAGRAPLSAALGELRDLDLASLHHQVAGLSLVKVGLAGCRGTSDWQARLKALQAELPSPVQLVAVVYADAAQADAPAPQEIVAAAQTLRLRTLLIDTFNKQRGDIWQALGDVPLRALVDDAHQAGMQVALAGSITLTTVPQALSLGPDWLAVRGAACAAGRLSPVERHCVAALKAAIRQSHPESLVSQ